MLKFKAETPFAFLDNGLARREGRINDQTPATEVKFSAGTFGQLQKRPYSQQIYVISGEFEFTVANDIHTVFAGETLQIPAATPFGCFCLVAGSLLEIPQPA
ncbi:MULTISPECIES: cupin domain-containing protein [unclassified Serratia (in: enterobacteria)]|uniref:cupin domain-containing protein n=1 Tax=unclassified Serratia (in: enterobacteria) TaxID=2647522 RepID=UPI0005040861|nr:MULTISPECIES: cupin domain-containing protein [unclassified Serratia (in: enterobacteria)]KFK94745.1 cupin [Serratia sp. Ag2]KFK99095.1 cupin [Serratia sp. Ag1]